MAFVADEYLRRVKLSPIKFSLAVSATFPFPGIDVLFISGSFTHAQAIRTEEAPAVLTLIAAPNEPSKGSLIVWFITSRLHVFKSATGVVPPPQLPAVAPAHDTCLAAILPKADDTWPRGIGDAICAASRATVQ